ncbi:hypothetical protein Hanom_Chr17g01585491 [Helianthus anomalus]
MWQYSGEIVLSRELLNNEYDLRATLMELCAAFWGHTSSSLPSPVLHHAQGKWLELWTLKEL